MGKLEEVLHTLLGADPVGIDLAADTAVLVKAHHTQDFDHILLVRTAVAVGNLHAADTLRMFVVAAADSHPVDNVQRLFTKRFTKK